VPQNSRHFENAEPTKRYSLDALPRFFEALFWLMQPFKKSRDLFVWKNKITERRSLLSQRIS
jgi:hypothetical protein